MKPKTLNTLSVKDKMMNAVEQELVDFDAIEDVPKVGTVTVEPVRKNKVSGDFSHGFSCYQHPDTGAWFGIPDRIGEDGKFVFKKIRMTGSRDFNLKNKMERAEFIMLKYYPGTIDSPWPAGKPRYRIYDPLAEARKEIEKHSARRKAASVVDDLIDNKERLNDLIGFSRVFGFKPEHEDILIIKKLMLDKAEKDPTGFLSKWENKQLCNTEIAIKRGIATALIKNVPGKGWMFNAITIGSSEQIMTSYFLENTDAMHQLDIESKKADTMFDQELSEKLAKEEVNTTENGHAPKTPEVVKEIVDNAEINEDPPVEEEQEVVIDEVEVQKKVNDLQEKCRTRGYPSNEWEHFSLVGELIDYMTSKAGGGFDED